MKINRILVPVDFSEVTGSVVKTAANIANKSGASITLFHVTPKQEKPEAESKLQSIAKQYVPDQDIDFKIRVAEGNILQQISSTAHPDEFDLVVIGSHGYKGLREKLFGTDILKLLKETEVPALVIQDGYELPDPGFENMLLPVGSHKSIDIQIDAVATFSKLFDAKVHVFTVVKPGTDWSEEMQQNLKKVESEFNARNVAWEKVREKATSFSVGFGRHILDYAGRNNINLITFIANAAREHYYVADSDKVMMLTNDLKIPILSVGDKSA